MHGAAVTLANRFKKLDKPDVIVVSDMLDLATFVGLAGDGLHGVKKVLYMHENQLTYPWSPTDEDVSLKRDANYAFKNYTSALAADEVYFNSDYHRNSFLTALPDFLKVFPDHQELNTVAEIELKSKTLHLGMDLKRFDEYKLEAKNDVPIILWNHRWEYDKNPQDFFQMLYALKDKGCAFKLVVLGERYKGTPAIFEEAKLRLQKEIMHWGYAASFSEYATWLWRADILLVTSNQDFFGGSVVEAIYCNTCPVLPNRLAYPEHVAESFLYDDQNELNRGLENALENGKFSSSTIGQYDWTNMIEQYDYCFTSFE